MIFIILFTIAITWIIQNHLRKKEFWKAINRIPGPKPQFLVGNAFQLSTDPVKFLKILRNFWVEHEMKTFKVTIGPFADAVVSTPEAIESVLSSSTLIDKHALYEYLHPWLGLGLLTSTGELWHSRRKIITPAFHFKILEEFVDVFNRNGDILVEKLQTHSNGEDFNISPFVKNASLDAICESAMGVSINAQQKDSEYAEAVAAACLIVHKRTVSPWLGADLIFYMTSMGRQFQKAVATMHKQVDEVIKEKKSKLTSLVEEEKENDFGVKKKMAFLDLLLMSKDQNGQALDDAAVRNEVHTFMFEGHDTTTSAIGFALYNLSKYPDIQVKVVEEQKSILGENFEQPLTYREANEMKYLERVIKESLRMFSTVPMMGRKITEDVTLLDGTFLPNGCNVTIAPFLMHYNPKLFTDPEKFNPERFTIENVKGANPYAYIPFSAGPRNCIGQKYALLEMKCIISKILQRYRLEACPDFEPVLTADLVLKSQNGIILRLKPRSK